MNIKFPRLCIVVFTFAALLSSTPAASSAPPLWRIADQDSTIWLFGTVHMLPAGVRWRSPALDRAFAAADTVIFEVDLSAPPRRGFAATLMQLGRNANYVTLSSLLDAKDVERLHRAALQVGVQPASLEPLRPWLASMRLGLTNLQTQGYDPEAGVDEILEAMARRAGKRLAYLETVQEQFEFFAALSPSAEKAFLMSAIIQIETDPRGLDVLVSAWAKGETHKFDRLFQAAMGVNTPELRDALFVNRNRRWTDQIDALMSGAGKALIAVGAGHLPGKSGVIELLRAKGYTVTRQ